MTDSLLQRMAGACAGASATRRVILELVLQDPERALEESFAALGQLGAHHHAHLP